MTYAEANAAVDATSAARDAAALRMRQAIGSTEYEAAEAEFFAAVAAQREALAAFDVAYAIEQDRGEMVTEVVVDTEQIALGIGA